MAYCMGGVPANEEDPEEPEVPLELEEEPNRGKREVAFREPSPEEGDLPFHCGTPRGIPAVAVHTQPTRHGLPPRPTVQSPARSLQSSLGSPRVEALERSIDKVREIEAKIMALEVVYPDCTPFGASISPPLTPTCSSWQLNALPQAQDAVAESLYHHLREIQDSPVLAKPPSTMKQPRRVEISLDSAPGLPTTTERAAVGGVKRGGGGSISPTKLTKAAQKQRLSALRWLGAILLRLRQLDHRKLLAGWRGAVRRSRAGNSPNEWWEGAAVTARGALEKDAELQRDTQNNMARWFGY